MAHTRPWIQVATAVVLVLVLGAATACSSSGSVDRVETESTRRSTTTRGTDAPTTPPTTTPATIVHTPAEGKDAPYVDGAVAGVDLSGLDLPRGHVASAWRTTVDETSTLTVSVAYGWGQDDPLVGEIDGVEVPSVFTAPDLTAFEEGYETPGLKLLLYSHDLTGGDQGALLARRSAGAGLADVCEGSDTYDYDDGLYQGTAEVWHGCSASQAAYLVVVAGPDAPDAAFDLVLEVQMLTLGDVDVAIQAIQTFLFTGSAEDVPGTSPAGPTGRDQAITLVEEHLRSCGMDWEDLTATDGGDGLWSVSVWIIPPATGEDGDPGTGEYWVDTGSGEVTSTNGTASVLCPG